MLNWLRELIRNQPLPFLIICGAVVPSASALPDRPKSQNPKNGSVTKPTERQRWNSNNSAGRVPFEADMNRPTDEQLGEALVAEIVSATATGFINAGFQAGLNWASDRRDPGQGLADPYVQNVVRLKQSASPKVRVKAAVGLIRIPCPAASKPFLKEALRTDPSEEVRKTCAMALGRIGDDECCDYLRKAMRYDSSKEVRLVCSAVLAKIHSEQNNLASDPTIQAGK